MIVHVCHCYFACKKTNGQTFTKFKLQYFSFDGLRDVQMDKMAMRNQWGSTSIQSNLGTLPFSHTSINVVVGK